MSDKAKLRRAVELLHEASALLSSLEYPNDQDVKNYERLADAAIDGINTASAAAIKAEDQAQ